MESFLCLFLLVHLLTKFLFGILVFDSVSSMKPSCHYDERSALLEFKQSFTINKSASYPKVLKWKPEEENDNCCSWDGVKCDKETGHVIGLDLSSSYLYGSINSNNKSFPSYSSPKA